MTVGWQKRSQQTSTFFQKNTLSSAKEMDPHKTGEISLFTELRNAAEKEALENKSAEEHQHLATYEERNLYKHVQITTEKETGGKVEKATMKQTTGGSLSPEVIVVKGASHTSVGSENLGKVYKEKNVQEEKEQLASAKKLAEDFQNRLLGDSVGDLDEDFEEMAERIQSILHQSRKRNEKTTPIQKPPRTKTKGQETKETDEVSCIIIMGDLIVFCLLCTRMLHMRRIY